MPSGLVFLGFSEPVRPEGFEPSTLGSEDRCAIQLRHGRLFDSILEFFREAARDTGTLGGGRWLILWGRWLATLWAALSGQAAVSAVRNARRPGGPSYGEVFLAVLARVYRPMCATRK